MYPLLSGLNDQLLVPNALLVIYNWHSTYFSDVQFFFMSTNLHVRCIFVQIYFNEFKYKWKRCLEKKTL